MSCLFRFVGVFCQCVLVLSACKLLVAFTRKTGVISGFCVGSCRLNQTNDFENQTKIDVQMLFSSLCLCRFIDFWLTSLSNSGHSLLDQS